MDGLQDVLRSIRGESQTQARDHLDVFREFLDHLDRAARKRPPRAVKSAKLREQPKRR
jgi:hypothetical protein